MFHPQVSGAKSAVWFSFENGSFENGSLREMVLRLYTIYT